MFFEFFQKRLGRPGGKVDSHFDVLPYVAKQAREFFPLALAPLRNLRPPLPWIFQASLQVVGQWYSTSPPRRSPQGAIDSDHLEPLVLERLPGIQIMPLHIYAYSAD